MVKNTMYVLPRLAQAQNNSNATATNNGFVKGIQSEAHVIVSSSLERVSILTLQRYRHNRSVAWANPQSTMTQNSRVSRLPRLPRMKLAQHSTNCLFWHDMWLVTSSSQLFNVLLTLLLAVNLSNHIDATSTNYHLAWMKVTWLPLRRLLKNR